MGLRGNIPSDISQLIVKIMNKKYLDKVLDQIVNETTIDYDEERFLPPFAIPSPIVPFPSFPISSLSPFSPYPSFIIHCREVYGLNKEEIGYVWDRYREIIIDEINNGDLPIDTQYVNESNNIDDDGWYYQYVFNSKFLSKVLGQLLSETKIEWDDQEKGISVKVTWDPYIGYQRDVSYQLFQRHCKEVYLLTPVEIADVYMLYMTELSERRRLRLIDMIRNNGL